jgi:ABC-type polysaccharide/polyol phosphate export permease
MIATYRRLFRGRALVWILAKKELKARYRGSALGFFWSLLNPLLLLAVYSVVFTIVFSPRGQGLHPYPVFLFGGVLAWSFLSGALLDAAETFRSNGPLLRKVIVAPEIFPGVSVTAQGLHFLLASPVLAAAVIGGALWAGGRAGWPAVQLVPVMLLLALAVLGGALLVSSISVHFRDLRDLLQNFLTFWFFASPVVYATSFLPERMRAWARLNPAAPFFEGVHDAIFYSRWIPPRHWAEMAAVSAAALLSGGAVFSRLRDSIAEEA